MKNACQEFYSWNQKSFGKLGQYHYFEVSEYGANLLQNSQERTLHN